MNKTKKVRVIVTIDVNHDEDLRDDQIEQIAVNSIHVKDKCGMFCNGYYETEFKGMEIFYYEY